MHETIPASLYPWLTYEASLTEKLRQAAGNAQLELTKQCFEAADDWDIRIANEHHEVLHREILMRTTQEVCWFARTTIPKETFQSDTVFFKRLESESLGNLVFNEPRIQRVHFSHYSIQKTAIEYRWIEHLLQDSSVTLGCRLSKFVFCNQFPFFLVEILLPGLMRYT